CAEPCGRAVGNHNVIPVPVRWAGRKCGQEGIAKLGNAMLIRVVRVSLLECLSTGVDDLLGRSEIWFAQGQRHRAGWHHPKWRAKGCFTLIHDALSDEVHEGSSFT